MPDKLTILVFLKDRAAFTKRLCDYFSLIRYPYPVFFADGSLEDGNEEFFKFLKNKNFNYTYKRYPKDISLLDYYKKCASSILEVKTPYVMLVDNDDFPIIEGQEKAINFLDNNFNYVGCNGRVAGIVLSPTPEQPFGDHILYLPYYCQTMDVQINVEQEQPVVRIKSYLTNFYSIFYSIFRTDSLACTFSKMEEFNFSELGIGELFFSYMQLSQGKIKSINSLTYVRQKGSSQAAASQKDWFYRLFYTNWLNDLKTAITYVAEFISSNTHKNNQEIYDKLYLDFINRQRDRYLPNNFYCLKNLDLLLHKSTLASILLNKIFKKVPNIGEKLSIINLKQLADTSDLQLIKKVISKSE